MSLGKKHEKALLCELIFRLVKFLVKVEARRFRSHPLGRCSSVFIFNKGHHSTGINMFISDMIQPVTVKRPNPRIIGRQNDIDPLAGSDLHGVPFLRFVDVTAVACNHDKLVGMGMHEMGLVANIDKPDPVAFRHPDGRPRNPAVKSPARYRFVGRFQKTHI